MDRLLYTVANGANRVLDAQAALTNNMANISTPGFRAQLAAYRSVPVSLGENDPAKTTRVLTVAVTAPSILDHGPTLSTGRALDAKIEGDGWFVVQDEQGNQGLTRAGNFHRNAQGMLVDAKGRLVMSAEDGPIEIGDADRISFSQNGGVNVIPQGGRARDVQQVAQLKRVNPPNTSLVRGEDGLFRSINAQGEQAFLPNNPNIKVLGGALEGSNVSAAESMVQMIENARRYEVQMKFIADANKNAQSANSILSVAT